MKFKKILPHIFIFIIFLFAAFYITYPLIFHLGTMATGYGDELLIAWIHSWIGYILFHNPLNIFNANLYVPYENTAAYSDLFFTTTLLSYLPVKLIGEPIVAHNFTFISSLAFLGFSIYLLTFYITKNYLASLLSGFLIIFSPATLDKYVHIQILAIQFVPLAILSFLVFIKERKTRYFLLTAVIFLMQTYNSFLPGFFILFSLVIILLIGIKNNQTKLNEILTWKNVIIILVTLLIVVPIAIPYFKVSNQFSYVRDIRETIHFALQPEDFIHPNGFTRLQPLLISLSQPYNYPSSATIKSGYIGFVFSLLILFSILFYRKIFRKKSTEAVYFLYISTFGFLLSLGPFLHFARKTIHEPFPIPLPYLPLYYVIPGFQGIRNSARWEMLFIIGGAVLAGIVLSIILKRFKKSVQYLSYLFLIFLVVAEYNFPMQFYKIQQVKFFPHVYHWLSTKPEDSKIIELPIYNWNMWPYTQNELWREYYSTVHFRKTVNGYSGFSPPPWQEFVHDTMTEFPSEKAVKRIQDLGVNYVIVHKDEYDLLHKDKFTVKDKLMPNGMAVIKELIKNKDLHLVQKFDEDYVFSFN